MIEIILGTFAMVFIMAITVTPIIVLNAWFVETVWNWIVVPTFHAPPLTLASAVGLAVLTSLFAPSQAAPTNGKTGKDAAIAIAGHVLGKYGIGLLIAYIVKGML